MIALDYLRHREATADTADQLADALRRLTDALTGDLIGADLYDELAAAVEIGCDALDAHETVGLTVHRLPQPDPPDDSAGPLCAFTSEPISSCTCTTCNTMRSDPPPDIRTRICDACAAEKPVEEFAATGSNGRASTCGTCADENPPAVSLTADCPDTGRAGRSCTCPAHTDLRTALTDDLEACRTCGTDTPIAQYPRSGGGWSKDCPACVAARGRRNRSKRRDRETSDDKEPV